MATKDQAVNQVIRLMNSQYADNQEARPTRDVATAIVEYLTENQVEVEVEAATPPSTATTGT
jgi:uncharacterized protein (UPF0147 family)